jgi:hypothetical protein
MRCPRQESNLGARFRKPALYPLSYGGEVENPLLASRRVYMILLDPLSYGA